MRLRLLPFAISCLLAGSVTGCNRASETAPPAAPPAAPAPAAVSYATQHLGDYVSVQLTADMSALDANDKQLLALLVQACDVMNSLYWQQAWGDKAALMARVSDPDTRRFVELNYGPWDALNDNVSFVEGIGPRPAGVTFYPADMSKAEFEAAALPDKTSWYTLLRRDSAGKLITVPFHEAYKDDLTKAAALLRQAAPLSKDAGFKNYLLMRADALLSDNFQPSDLA